MNEIGLASLLWIQNHRPVWLENAALTCTGWGEEIWIFTFLALLFWVFGRRFAYRTGFALAPGMIFTVMVKISACIPRPWVRNPAIIPNPSAQWGAWGYSFPSGHSSSATLLAGGLAGAIRRPWAWGMAAIWIILMGSSRAILGVHTLLDISCGILISLAIVILMGRIYDWSERHPERRWVVLLGALFYAAAAWLYATHKPVPEDYNPLFTRDALRTIVGAIAFFFSWYIESRNIRFEPARLGAYRLPAAILGIILLHLIHEHLHHLLVPFLPGEWPYYIRFAAIPVFTFVIWPLLLQPLTKRAA